MKKDIIKYLIILCIFNCNSKDLKKSNLFLSLCSEFWDFNRPFVPNDEYFFYHHYATKARGLILEPMCGTGRFLIPFAQEGFNIEGFDASPFMLNELRKKCENKKIVPQVWEQFLEDVPVTKKYSLIFIPDTSFAIFTDLSQVKKCLQKIYSLLKPGGIFVFDIQTIYARWGEIGIWTQKSYKKQNGDEIIENSLPLPIENSLSTLLFRYELVHDGKIIKVETEPYQIRLYEPEQMDSLLKEAGFKKIRKKAAYDVTKAPSATDQFFVYECTK